MKQSDVKIYTSEELLFEAYENSIAIFPCSTPNLKYNALTSHYEPTEPGLSEYGIDVARQYPSINSNKLEEFIKKTTRQFYEYLMNMDGCDIDKIEYMIARSISPTVTNQYKMRHIIESAIYAQAEYFLKKGDKQTYGTSTEGEQMPIESNRRHFNDATHISPVTHNYLISLGILYAADITILGYNPRDHKDW